ncbi:hypothetical protein GCK72_017761 [Caenorhabditis remanei]|uniref:Uncharacterized protein n=1 Tax=Caenorhabditis remanei TaxID=31234 RepID=A0A6A5G869_CAERE|nr:hypothetical protein GCK72_017761 [Caenorhabditis remanei]KAF1751207.1 hypothetical protein GCK72_017761 [Caenorhabditis remanei]
MVTEVIHIFWNSNQSLHLHWLGTTALSLSSGTWMCGDRVEMNGDLSVFKKAEWRVLSNNSDRSCLPTQLHSLCEFLDWYGLLVVPTPAGAFSLEEPSQDTTIGEESSDGHSSVNIDFVNLLLMRRQLVLGSLKFEKC